MTTIDVSAAATFDVVAACDAAGLPRPDVVGAPGADPRTLSWTPDLSAAQLATAQDVVAAAQANLSITRAEWVALKPDVAALRTYVGIASPTAAQTAAATKAIIRVLRAVLRT